MRTVQKDKQPKKLLGLLLTIFIIALIILASLFIKTYVLDDQQASTTPSNPTGSDPEGEAAEPVLNQEADTEQFTEIRIAAAGDIMFHDTQLESAYNTKTDTYEFHSVFEDVKPIFQAADLAIANYETTAAGPDRAYTGYPSFNSPDETIDAIKQAGIDVLTTANNHSLDTGSKGLKRTVQVIREKGLSSVGTYDKKPNSRVLMKEVKGINLAILAYTESTNGIGAQYPTDELNAMINLMDETIIKEDIQEAKDNGADMIISFMHWGEEYAPNPNAKQVALAEMMAEEGVDIILGSHPHVIQKSDFITIGDKQTFVIYSMGNFVSNQRRETLGTGFETTEDGIIVQIDIRKNEQTAETTIVNVDYVPTWVYRNKEQGQSNYTYRILPIENFLDSADFSTTFKERMSTSLETTVSKMEPFSSKE